jgi:hypothetical protein
MKRCFLFLILIEVFVIAAGSGAEFDKVHKGTNPDTVSYESPMWTFVPDCQVILFGQVLEQVTMADQPSPGILIERTEKGVLINDQMWVPAHVESKHSVMPNEAAQQEGNIIEEAAEQFRRQHKKDESGRFLVNGTAYGEMPQPFFVERFGETVELAVKPGIAGLDYIFVTYQGMRYGMPLHPLPAPSQEEQQKRRLDNAYKMAVNYSRPGTIILVTRSQFTPFPKEKADALIAALQKIPSLAVPVAENIYGEIVYKSLNVDGFFFGPDVVATFALKK